MKNKNKSASIRKNYENIATFFIPVILTFLIDIYKTLYGFVVNTKDPNGNTLKDAFPWSVYICLITCFLLYIVTFCIVLKINDVIKKKLFNTPDEEKYMKDSFLRLKEFGFKRQDGLKTDLATTGPINEYVQFLIKMHLKSINLVVSTCLDFFTDSFSERGKLVDEDIFEVSFMSKSYKDNKITIVSADNNKHRTPPSMLQRGNNPDLYDNTETAKLYERYNNKPSEALSIHIVEDCSKHDEFISLYEGQKNTIKSMAVLPILSSKNELLGTLVVCVNKPNFFKIEEHHFWNELLEIYSVELGYHYLALDYCIQYNNDILSDTYKKPF